jgi:hypothetical protein
MKNSTSKIKEFFRKTFARIGSDPKKDWNVFILLISILLSAVAFYHISLFFSASEKTPDLSSIGSAGVKTLDRAGLTNLLKDLEARETEYKDFTSKSQVFKDPSF